MLKDELKNCYLNAMREKEQAKKQARQQEIDEENQRIKRAVNQMDKERHYRDSFKI